MGKGLSDENREAIKLDFKSEAEEALEIDNQIAELKSQIESLNSERKSIVKKLEHNAAHLYDWQGVREYSEPKASFMRPYSRTRLVGIEGDQAVFKAYDYHGNGSWDYNDEYKFSFEQLADPDSYMQDDHQRLQVKKQREAARREAFYKNRERTAPIEKALSATAGNTPEEIIKELAEQHGLKVEPVE